MEGQTFTITAKSKHFNKRKHLERYMNRNVGKIDNFDRIVCCGNSYDLTSCEYIAELISEKAADDLSYADFSDMFTQRDRSMLPPSLKLLIDAIAPK